MNFSIDFSNPKIRPPLIVDFDWNPVTESPAKSESVLSVYSVLL